MVLYGRAHLFEIGLGVKNGFATSSWLGFEPGNAFLLIAFDSAIDAHHAAANQGCDLVGQQGVGFEQDRMATGAKGMAGAVAEVLFSDHWIKLVAE